MNTHLKKIFLSTFVNFLNSKKFHKLKLFDKINVFFNIS